MEIPLELLMPGLAIELAILIKGIGILFTRRFVLAIHGSAIHIVFPWKYGRLIGLLGLLPLPLAYIIYKIYHMLFIQSGQSDANNTYLFAWINLCLSGIYGIAYFAFIAVIGKHEDPDRIPKNLPSKLELPPMMNFEGETQPEGETPEA